MFCLETAFFNRSAKGKIREENVELKLMRNVTVEENCVESS